MQALVVGRCALGVLVLLAQTALGFSSPVQKKVALVTGSNKGIGKEIARLLGKESGFAVVLACRSTELGNKAVAELQADGCTDLECIKVDLTNAEDFQAAHDHVEQTYGRLDVLINNAAICFNDPTLYGKVEPTPFEKQAGITVRTNFFGTLGLTTSMMPLLRKSGSPRVINVASAAGRLAILRSDEKVQKFTSESLTIDKLKGLMQEFITAVESGDHAEGGWPNTCYGMSKLGMIAMTKIFSREEPKMMFNNVDPGYCATDQNNNQGFRSAEQGAMTPFLLATLSDDDEFYSGLYWFDGQTIEW